MVNLARSAAFCCTITTLIRGLTSLLQLLCILLSINREAYRNNRQRCLERVLKKVLTGLHDSCSSQIDCSLSLYCLALTRVSFRDFPLRYEVRGGSLKIFLTPENEVVLA